MANTYELIEAQTLGTTATSVTFSSIPGTYTDLKLVASVRTAWASDTNDQLLEFRFNGDTGSNYTYRQLTGTGNRARLGNCNNDICSKSTNLTQVL
jgi:hypothetical protein